MSRRALGSWALLAWCGAVVAWESGAASAAMAVRDGGLPDSLALSELERGLWLHEAQVEAWYDPATWAAMDGLLSDPVTLPHGAIMRLAVLPWLTAAHLEALRHASGVRSWQDLAQLPRWDAELARRSAPFLRFRRTPASWSVRAQSRWSGGRREARWEAGGSGWSAALRLRLDVEPRHSGFLALQRQKLRLVAGDLRLGVSQGLLWWSSESDLRASSAALRRPRSLAGTEVGGAPRTLRGAGFELGLGPLQVQAVQGRVLELPLSGLVTAVNLPGRMRLRLCGLRLQHRSRCSVAWAWEDPSGRVELEVVPRGTGDAAALALERRFAPWRVTARLQLRQPTRGASLAAAGSTERNRFSRHALLRAERRWGTVHGEVALHRRVRHDSLGNDESTFEHRWRARWRGKNHSLEVRLRQREDTQEELGVEGPEPRRHQSQRGVVLRFLRALDDHSSFGLDYRLEEGRGATGETRGSAWQVHFQHRRGWFRGQVALTSFAAPSGLAAPTVADPGIGTVPASRQLVGDGIRTAGALRLSTRRFEAAARGARSFAFQGSRRFEWELSLRLQVH